MNQVLAKPRFYLKMAQLMIAKKFISPEVISKDYDNLSRGYDEYFSSYIRKHSLIMVAKLGIKKNACVLDLASGTGAITLQLAEDARDGQVYAVDNSKGMIGKARQKAKKNNLCNIQFIKGNMIEEIAKFPDAYFDVVTCGWAIGYVSPKQLLKQIRRVLKKDGCVGIIENRQDTLIEIRNTSMRVAESLSEHIDYIMDLPLRLPRSTSHLKNLFSSASLKPEELWDGQEPFVFKSGADVLNWIMHTGASAGFDHMMSPEAKEVCDKRFAELMEKHYLKEGKINVAHRYVAGIARKEF